MANAEVEPTLHSLWEDLSGILRRRKALIGIVAASVLTVVYVGLLFISDQFEAQASLLVKIGRENTETPVTVEKGSVFPNGIRKEEINSYIALLVSRPLMDATLKEIGFQRFLAQPPPPASLFGRVKYVLKSGYRWCRTQLDELQILLALKRRLSQEELVYLSVAKSLKVEREKDADVIQLKLRLPDPVLARDVLQTLARKYAARHIEVVGRDESALRIFEAETQSSGVTLSALRDKVLRRKSELGVTAVAEQKTQLLELLRVAESTRLDSEREQARIQAEKQALLQQKLDLEEFQLTGKLVNPSATRTRVRQSLAELQVEKNLALSKYQPGADPVKKAEAQIAGLEAAYQQIPADEDGSRTLSRNPILSFVESRLAEDDVKAQALAAVLEKTKGQVAQLKSELQRLDQAEAELQKLQLEVNVAESRFVSNASRREQARGQETLDRWQVANVVLLSPASYSEKPVAPKRLLIVLLGGAGGILVGVGLALLLEWQGNVIHTPQDLERIAPGTWLGTYSPAVATQELARGRLAGASSPAASPADPSSRD